MHIDWWTLALQAVNALVLIWLLAHFLFRPVVDAIAARQKAAGQLLADAKAAKAAAEAERDKAGEAPGGNPRIAWRGWRVDPSDGRPCGNSSGSGGLPQGARRGPRPLG